MSNSAQDKKTISNSVGEINHASKKPKANIGNVFTSVVKDKRSFITNCIFEHRKDNNDILFDQQDNGLFVINLNGYALIPKEEYEMLKGWKS